MKQEAWKSGRGSGQMRGAGYEVCGVAVRLELCRLVLADGNRNKMVEKGGVFDACENTLLKTCMAAEILLLYS